METTKEEAEQIKGAEETNPEPETANQKKKRKKREKKEAEDKAEG